MKESTKIILTSCAESFIIALIVKLIWNYLIVSEFGLPPLGYWQAYLLVVLCQFLFVSHSVTSFLAKLVDKEK